MNHEDRVFGCLSGIAVGDAIGKQTETLSLEAVRHWYPYGVRGFEDPPDTVIPRYVGNSKREWRIGETTDDTERTIAVARAIIHERVVSHVGVGREMLQCTKCVHPGIPSLWEFHQAGDPARTATAHDGCGAAVRVAPVGIIHSSSNLDCIVNDAREASISTHGGSLAIAAAAATAAAVSAAIDGFTADDVFGLAVRAAEQTDMRWPGGAAGAFAAALREVRGTLASLRVLHPAGIASACFPDRPLTIVPLAIGLGTIAPSAEDAILVAANVGGDADSVASIAGGILGAMRPATVNRHWYDIVERVNRHDLAKMARDLAVLRR